jgi:hypothetical protein
VGPLELTLARSLAAPSTESRTRRSPNFGKTNIPCLISFWFDICDPLAAFELLCRFSVYHIVSSRHLKLGLKIEIERSKFGAIV